MNATIPEVGSFPTVTIQVRAVDNSWETRMIEVHNLWLHGNRVYARLPKTELVAELDLTNPEQGWLVYPN